MKKDLKNGKIAELNSKFGRIFQRSYRPCGKETKLFLTWIKWALNSEISQKINCYPIVGATNEMQFAYLYHKVGLNNIRWLS